MTEMNSTVEVDVDPDPESDERIGGLTPKGSRWTTRPSEATAPLPLNR